MWSECQAAYLLPETHVSETFFSGATLNFLDILLRSGAKAATGCKHNRDENVIALIVLNNRSDSGAAALLALTCVENAQDRVGASKNARTGDRGLGDGHLGDLKHHSLVRFAVEVGNIAVIVPRWAQKTHLSSRDISDPTQPRHLGNVGLGLVMGLQSTSVGRADLDGMLAVLSELDDMVWS